MTLMNAMYSGSSALTNMGSAMSVIGNNLSNTNTTSFKRSSTGFEDILAQTVGTTVASGANQIGNGVAVSVIKQDLTQGAFEYTGIVTDMAIDGDGYFMVKDYSTSSEGAVYYTRAGDFGIDITGDLVTNSGLVVQGWELNEDGDRLGEPSDINLSSIHTASEPTSVVDVAVNLDSTAEAPADAYDPNDPTTYNFSTTVQVYDSTGDGHNVEIHFVKLDEATYGYNAWAWHAVVQSTELQTADQAASGVELTAVDDPDLDGYADEYGVHVEEVQTNASYTAGELIFTSAGLLSEEGSTPITFNWGGGSAGQQILFNFGDAIGTDATGRDSDSTNDYSGYDRASDSTTYLEFTDNAVEADVDFTGSDGTVQYAAGFSTLNISQDGFPAGFLEQISVDEYGKIYGSFTNGLVKPLYQISLATFSNEDGLSQIGGNLYAETYVSGQRIQGTAQSGRFGSVISHSLEQSNVDMSEEFVSMITVQRGFQANSRIVSVVDSMLEELINLKR